MYTLTVLKTLIIYSGSMTSLDFKSYPQMMEMSMNRFIIEEDVEGIAKSLCEQHIVKMPLEEAQMLCTSLWHHAPE